MGETFNRRRFLAATAGIVGATAWQTSLAAEQLVTDRQAIGTLDSIQPIDTHTHFYDPSRPQGVPWPAPSEKRLYRTVLPKDYRALKVSTPVAGTVVVEASPWVEDNQWLLDLAAREPFIRGIVGSLPVGTKQFAGHLKRFAANSLFRGIRLRDYKLDRALENPAFLGDLKLLAVHGLTLDLVGDLEMVTFADQLAQKVPDLRIVIDHLAGVRIDGKTPPADWLSAMRALARRPSIWCKVSGLVEGTGRSDGTAPREAEFYQPVLDAMWTRFGPARLVYASNWPVSELFAPLGTVQGIVADYVRGKAAGTANKIFCENAREVYRLAKS